MPLYYWLVVFIPISLILHWMHASPTLDFVVACIAIIPLAGVMGRATEEWAKHTGPTIGGLLNATFGNATELIIALFAVRAGLLEMVKASITGSILGNLLLVLGLSVLAGGLKYKMQQFNEEAAGMHSAMMVLAVIGLVVPSAFIHATPNGFDSANQEALSLGVAGVLMLIYLFGLFFSLKTHESLFTSGEEHEEPLWSKRRATILLAVSTLFVAVESEFLVGSVEHVVQSFGISELFLGIVIVPIIGNAAEHSAAVMLAMKNKMDISLGIAVGSSTQVALFVAPAIVFLSLLMGHPMTYVFNQYELVAMGFAVMITAIISLDGKTHWLEGAQLLAAYLIMALAFFFIPG
ncbi:MAG: calcium/proton exchanger [Armatimonadetes bacterium]|nr:calcium/proton exchanger [Armatimonadota bacterium]